LSFPADLTATLEIRPSKPFCGQHAHPTTTPEISTAAKHINEWVKKVRLLAHIEA
jgi:hypothetical protein